MKKEFTRREVLGAGLGAAALATAGAALTSTVHAAETPAPASELETYNKFGEELRNSLLLRSSPLAIKMLEKEADIPQGAFRPKKDGGYHLAQCQAFGMSRREGKTVAMLKEDHWCPTALEVYGMVEKATQGFSMEYSMSFETGKYVGIVSAPLSKANFMPDVIMIYMNPAQLREALFAMNLGGSDQVKTELFLPSCGHSVVDPMKTGKYVVVLPDPGEYQRALVAEEEVILSVPKQKIQAFMAMQKQNGQMHPYRDQFMSMKPDFERPPFYVQKFKSWGLD